MSGIGFAFVVLPCIVATIVAALLRDWRLAAAATCGASALVFISPLFPQAWRLFALPPITGVTLGAATTLIALRIRPSIDIWSRMIWALVVTAVAGFILLSPFLIGN